MAAVKYQLLYRYINEATNTPITNNMSNVYEKAEDFQTDCHPIQQLSNPTAQAKAEEALEEMIVYGNNIDNPKNDMLFAYAGTRKIKHPVLTGGHRHIITEYPYVIKDTYVRIPMSPWFVHATYGSLDAALDKARVLIDMIGFDNVKLIKIVPFDQFVKIQ